MRVAADLDAGPLGGSRVEGNRIAVGRGPAVRAAGVLLLAFALLCGVPAGTRAQGPPAAGEGSSPREADRSRMPLSVRWGPERLGLIRYNRVEGGSVGVRVAALPTWFGAPVRAVLTARLGWGGPTPDARLELEHVTLRRIVGVGVYSEIAAVDPTADPLGPAGSLLSALAGRDDGDYYRRSGAALWWASPPGDPLRFRIRAYSDRHHALATNTGLALPRLWDRSWRHRANLVAEEGWEHGVEATARLLLGQDPRRIRGSVEWMALAATGSADFARGSGTVRVGLPLPADFRIDLAASGGASAGAVTRQRLWTVGGPAHVRGYVPRALVGRCFWTTRVELAYTASLGDIVAFSDAGNAGPCDGSAAAGSPGRNAGVDALASVGGAVFLVDGALRLSAAWTLTGGSSRVDLMVIDRP